MSSADQSKKNGEGKAAALRRELARGRVLHGIGVFDGLSALLTNRHPYDALWISGLGVSAAHGVPDASIVTMAENLAAARIVEATSPLPIIADCDTGFGDVNNVRHMVREYERAGIAAVCIEDKVFPKRNSFSDGQSMADPHEFAVRIAAAKRAQRTADFMVVARIESLVAGETTTEALARAALYVRHGADAVLIHSKAKDPAEVIEFSVRFRNDHPDVPLIAIPTTYPTATSADLAAAGVNMVIYANQILRAFVQAADDVLHRIAGDSSSAAVESQIAPVQELLALIGTNDIREVDAWYATAVDKARTDA